MSDKGKKKSKNKEKAKQKDEKKVEEKYYDASGIMTDDEKKKVPELRDAVEKRLKEEKITDNVKKPDPNFPMTDFTYLRYLRARKYDMEEAAQYLVETVQWRLKMTPWLLDENAVACFQQHVSSFLYGRDKKNQPLYWSIPRNDPKMDYNKEAEKTFRMVIYIMEEFMRSYNKDGCRLNFMADLKGMSLFHNDDNWNNFFLTTLSHHYPETVGDIVIVDAPWIFYPIWALAKYWIDPITRDKISMISKSGIDPWLNPDEWPKTLLGKKDEEYVYKPVAPGIKIPTTIEDAVVQDGIPLYSAKEDKDDKEKVKEKKK